MPGAPLDLEFAETGDSTSAVLAKFNANFQALETDLEAPVTQSEILIGGNLDFNGYGQDDVGAVSLVDLSSALTTPGTITRANGILYFADSTGAIAITNGAGGLNATGIGGIGGDYGGADPSEVAYEAAADEYSFTGDPGNYSGLVCDYVKFPTSGGGSLKVTAASAIASAKTYTLGDLPATTSCLTIDSSGNVVAGATVAAQTVTTLTVTNPIKHGTRTMALPLATAQAVTNSFTRLAALLQTFTATNTHVVFPICLPVGCRVLSARVYTLRSGAGTLSIGVYYGGITGSPTAMITPATTATTGGPIDLTCSGTPAAIAATQQWFVEVIVPTTADSIYHCEITYDVP
jgi:hypothetical protein